MHVLIVEPDRTVAKCLKDEFQREGVSCSIATDAHEAIEIADESTPDVVITELMLAGNSGTEFIYEFRTYSDWENIPIIVYSSVKPPVEVTQSKDWKNVSINTYLYKPVTSIKEVVTASLELTNEQTAH